MKKEETMSKPSDTVKEEILKKAIKKAVENGWKEILPLGNIKIICVMDGSVCEIHRNDKLYATSNDIIFSHDFAKAFWGNKPHKIIKGNGVGGFNYFMGENWEYHLQQLVLEEDPISYLAKFL